MFVLLSKILDLAASPLTWALLLVLLALLWVAKRPGWARALLALAALVLYAFSIDPVSQRLWARLESRAPSTFRPTPPYDVAVVLGGMVESGKLGEGPPELSASAERILAAAELLRTGQARAMLITGGDVFPRPGRPPEAEVLAAWLRAQGLPADRIVVEGQSRNTRENALLSAPIIAGHGWKRVLLVTSAWHAPRALGCFRAVGLEPDLLPVDHRVHESAGFVWLPRAARLADTTDALRELLGGAVYRARGWLR